MLIHGPPGYGKSSLLCEWAEADERPFVWLEPDGQKQTLGSPDAIVRLIRRLRSRYHRFVLVVDDAHLVAPSSLRAVIEASLTSLPDDSLVALASRSTPQLPLGRLRTHRALVEIGMHQLAMPPAEATSLLRCAGREPGPEAVAELVRRTEGWPAALYLAALSLAGEPEADGSRWHFRGSDYLLTEYLRDDVLSGLPTDLAQFAIRTSVLHELSAPVCDAVLETGGSALALAKLSRITELLVPVDSERHRFRWHSLFRETLEGELRRSTPEFEAQLHRRALSWYSEKGDAERAIEHAVAAGDPQTAGDLIWANIPSYLAQGRGEDVERWMTRFTEDRIAGSAPLALSAAHSALAAGDLPRAERWAVLVGEAVGRARESDDPRSLKTGLAVIDALVAKRAVDMAAAAARTYEVEPRDSPWRPIVALLSGVAAHLMGDRPAALRLLDEGSGLGAATEPGVASLCLAQRAMIAIEQKDWDAAAEAANHAVDVLEQRGLTRCPTSALVFAVSSAVRAHQGRADEAKRDLRRGIDLLTSLGEYVPWYGAEARILLAHASLRLANVVGARSLLSEASRLARRTPDAIIFEQWFDEAWAYLDTIAETSLAGPSSLTIAELRVLRFLPSHRSFREIAAQLGVSANTVKTQAHAIYRKLGVVSRSEAVIRACESGLLGQ